MIGLYIIVLLQLIQIARSDYIAAVAEHQAYAGTETDTNDYRLSVNLELYSNLTALAANHKAQILVFPEFGLNPLGESSREDLTAFAERIGDIDPSALTTPCQDSRYQDKPILSKMSCAAQKNRISVLVNMVDWIDCDQSTDSNCPSDNHYQYNTDVVFNEKGQLVLKYHKSHEFPALRKAYDQYPAITEVTYISSFGIEFGIFICFDIMFEDPPKKLREKGIEHFLYAVSQGQLGEKTLIEGWSKNNNAVLLSSNFGAGKKDCSGIINRGEVLDAKKYHLVNSDFASENILVATVPA